MTVSPNVELARELEDVRAALRRMPSSAARGGAPLVEWLDEQAARVGKVAKLLAASKHPVAVPSSVVTGFSTGAGVGANGRAFTAERRRRAA